MATLFNPATARYRFRSRAITASLITITSPTDSSTSSSPDVTLRPSKVVLSASKSRQSQNNRNEFYRAAADDVFTTLLRSSESAPAIQRPIVLRRVEQRTWELFHERFGSHPSFALSKWEYDDVNKKIICIPLPSPFHDFSVTVMGDHVHHGMRDANLDTSARIRSLRVNRENMQKSTATGQSQREADCTLYTSAYHSGIIPTIVWEVGHSQKRQSLVRRAKMWCRRYDGQVRAVILVKYLCRNPRVNCASILLLFRPVRKQDGKWTALQDGPIYTLFPRPADAGTGTDAVPLVYEDYFGPGNIGVGKTGQERFDLPLELVRELMEESIAITRGREGYRFVSGGSSVAGQQPGAVVEEDMQDSPLVAPALVPSIEGDFEAFGDDWDAAMSDVSDD